MTKFIIALWVCLAPLAAFAQVDPSIKAAEDSRPAGDDEILSGPFSEYGEFDSAEDEASDEKFFQFSRFFGVGLGSGFTTFSGNAGKLYQGGFPTVDFRLNYWFDFQFALQLGAQNSKHNYNVKPDGLTEVNMFRFLAAVKYYFDVRDLSAAVSFVGPHLLAGAGFYQRTDNVGSGSNDATIANTVSTQQAVGFHGGGGFELTIVPKKTYLDLEFVMHYIQFRDQYEKRFQPFIDDRTGLMLTFGVVLLWTW